MSSSGADNEVILRGNIDWHIQLIAIQVSHAEKVQGRARSGYYKLAVLLIASIVEAVVHALLVRKLGTDGVIETEDYETYECLSLPEGFSLKGEVAICKKRKKIFQLKKNPDFAVLNNACVRERLLSLKLFNEVESIRKVRNKIHMQGLDHIDRSYTKSSVERFSEVMDNLLILYDRA